MGQQPGASQTRSFEAGQVFAADDVVQRTAGDVPPAAYMPADQQFWVRPRQPALHAQRPLWASVASKSDQYSDVHYVERPMASDTVVTLPLATLTAFPDHGRSSTAIDVDPYDIAAALVTAARLGVDVRRLLPDP